VALSAQGHGRGADFDIPAITVGRQKLSQGALAGRRRPDDPAITLATDSCIVELVDAAGRPAPPQTGKLRRVIPA
jgi:hypothetical protein